VWCFAFSHIFTFELIPQSRDRPVGSLGDITPDFKVTPFFDAEYRRNGRPDTDIVSMEY